MSNIPPQPLAAAGQAGRSRLDSMMGGPNGQPTGQVPMGEANYRPAEDPAQACGTCIHFDDQQSCDVVAGRIVPDGVSDLYEPRDTTPGPTAEEAVPATAPAPLLR